MCLYLCTTVLHNTAQTSSANLLSSNNHHRSDVVYWRGGAVSGTAAAGRCRWQHKTGLMVCTIHWQW